MLEEVPEGAFSNEMINQPDWSQIREHLKKCDGMFHGILSTHEMVGRLIFFLSA